MRSLKSKSKQLPPMTTKTKIYASKFNTLLPPITIKISKTHTLQNLALNPMQPLTLEGSKGSSRMKTKAQSKALSNLRRFNKLLLKRRALTKVIPRNLQTLMKNKNCD
jgi:hypothetical protein